MMISILTGQEVKHSQTLTHHVPRLSPQFSSLTLTRTTRHWRDLRCPSSLLWWIRSVRGSHIRSHNDIFYNQINVIKLICFGSVVCVQRKQAVWEITIASIIALTKTTRLLLSAVSVLRLARPQFTQLFSFHLIVQSQHAQINQWNRLVTSVHLHPCPGLSCRCRLFKDVFMLLCCWTDMRQHIIYPDCDIKFTGHVTWVGKTSIEAKMHMSQVHTLTCLLMHTVCVYCNLV